MIKNNKAVRIIVLIIVLNLLLGTEIFASGQITSITSGDRYYMIDLNDWNYISYGKYGSSTPVVGFGIPNGIASTNWKFTYDSGKAAYKISLESSSRYLGIKTDTCSSYPTVTVYDSDSANNNRYWTVTRNSSNNTFTISPKLYPNTVLSRSGYNLIVRDKNTSYVKNWRLYKYSDYRNVEGIIDVDDEEITVDGYTNAMLYWTSMGYAVNNYTNGTEPTLSQISSKIESANTAIIVLEGHGSDNGRFMRLGTESRVTGGRKYAVSEGDNNTNFEIRFSNNKLKKLKLIMFLGCATAHRTKNFASVAVQNGAQTAIGFYGIPGSSNPSEYTVYEPDVTLWEERFAYYCNLGYNANTAMESADRYVTADLKANGDIRTSSLVPQIYGNQYQLLRY